MRALGRGVPGSLKSLSGGVEGSSELPREKGRGLLGFLRRKQLLQTKMSKPSVSDTPLIV